MPSTCDHNLWLRAFWVVQTLSLGCAPESVAGAPSSAATQRPAQPSAAPNYATPLAGAAGAEVRAAQDPSVEQTQSSHALPAKDRVAWPQSASQIPSNAVGSVTGEVYDAISGQPILTGTVTTAAACAGTGCTSAGAAPAIVTSAALINGTFIFDAYALQPAQLSLEGDSAFMISAAGYDSVTFAHGPYDAAAESGSSTITRFPKIYLCPNDSPHSDSDGICDAAERQYGTDPGREDSDKDAINDRFELYGKPLSPGYALDLRGLGLRATHLDVIVEVDYMPGRAPLPAAIAAVVRAFKDAPVINESEPGRSTGIDLHVFIDEELTETSAIDFYTLNEAVEIRDEHLSLRAGLPVHYGLIGTTLYTYGKQHEKLLYDSSGRSDDVPGELFVITLGDDNANAIKLAGTFMHQLGHNLGLWHGGHQDTHFKPNYFSVMSYAYQLTGLPLADATDGLSRLDYARGSFKQLSEADLDETAGFTQLEETATANELSVVYKPQRFERPTYCRRQKNAECAAFGRFNGQVPGPINFDLRSDLTSSTTADLDGNGSIGDSFDATVSDWRVLKFAGLRVGVDRTIQEPMTPCPPASDLVFEDDPDDQAEASDTDPTTPAGDISLPPAAGSFDYQLSSRYPAAAAVSIISSNAGIAADPSQPALGDQPLDTSRYNICYLNVLQTQAEDYNFWLANHPDLILHDRTGQPVHDPDPDWQGELLFDISSAEKRTQLLELQRPWIAACRAAGFLAIEPDNLDSFERSGGVLSADDAENFMQQFVAEAHAQGLAVAQKNVTEWVNELGLSGAARSASIGFDFAIIEECQLTGECAEVIAYYGAPLVFEIEYVYETPDASSGVRVAANSSTHFDQACAARGQTIRIVLRDRDVRPASDPGYVFALCGLQSANAPVDNTQTLPAPADDETDTESEPEP